jgi:hypothetical protein
MCNICGALVGDIDMHAGWHRQPAPAPDPWEEELAREGCTELAWDGHLASALRWLSGALEGREGGFPYRIYLLRAAAHVRAMAPEGTQWEEPWQVQQGTERNTLRSVIRSLVHADTKHGPSPADTAGGLVAAESYLHGLWLAAVEEK